MIKKIGTDELHEVMYICGMERSGCTPVFLMNDILIKTPEDLKRILAKGYSHVYVSLREELFPPPSQSMPAEGGKAEDASGKEDARIEGSAEPAVTEAETIVFTADDEPGPGGDEAVAEEVLSGGTSVQDDFTSFEEELEVAGSVRNDAEQLVRDFLKDARLGRRIDSSKVEDTVDKMVDSVIRNQDALLSLARLKSFDDYTFAHCVNVCILSLALGRQMGMSKEGLYHLGLGAILHDVGKMLVPQHVLNKPGRLTEEEFSLMKRHSELGAKALSGMSCMKEASLEVVLQHHERYDGTGYFRGLSGDYIHPFARIAAVADVYDAMTSNRVYQKGMPPEDALKRLYQMRGTFFDPEMVERLIKCTGVYPIGTFVELNTGETAIVRMINHAFPLQPQVILVYDSEGAAYPKPTEADLKENANRWIVGSKRPSELGLSRRYRSA